MPGDTAHNGRTVTTFDKMISDQLRVVRRNSGLTLDELATKLGLSYQQVHKYENGTNRISAGRLLEISMILDVPVTTLYPTQIKVDAPQDPWEEVNEICSDFERGIAAFRTAIHQLQG